jgi:hypothetical protein
VTELRVLVGRLATLLISPVAHNPALSPLPQNPKSKLGTHLSLTPLLPSALPHPHPAFSSPSYHLLVAAAHSLRVVILLGKDENGREIFWIFQSHFSYFIIIFVLFRKYGKWYGNGIGYCGAGQNTIGFPYHPFSY